MSTLSQTAPHSPSSLPAVISTTNNGEGMPTNQMQSDSSSPFRARCNYDSVCFHFIRLQINGFPPWQKHLSSLVLLWHKNQVLFSADWNTIYSTALTSSQQRAESLMSPQMRSMNVGNSFKQQWKLFETCIELLKTLHAAKQVIT